MDKSTFLSGAFLIIGPPQHFLKNVNKILRKTSLKLENNPNVLCLREEKLGIEEIKKLKNFFAQKKWENKQMRLVLIFRGEGLSLPAQNALLKTLEELRGGDLIFIGTSNKRILIPTILSRSQIISSSFFTSAVSAPPLNLEVLRKISPLERLATAAREISKDDLEQTIGYYQQKISQNEKDWPWLKRALESCLRAQKMLAANLRAETVVDWLLLNL